MMIETGSQSDMLLLVIEDPSFIHRIARRIHSGHDDRVHVSRVNLLAILNLVVVCRALELTEIFRTIGAPLHRSEGQGHPVFAALTLLLPRVLPVVQLARCNVVVDLDFLRCMIARIVVRPGFP